MKPFSMQDLRHRGTNQNSFTHLTPSFHLSSTLPFIAQNRTSNSKTTAFLNLIFFSSSLSQKMPVATLPPFEDSITRRLMCGSVTSSTVRMLSMEIFLDDVCYLLVRCLIISSAMSCQWYLLRRNVTSISLRLALGLVLGLVSSPLSFILM